MDRASPSPPRTALPLASLAAAAGLALLVAGCGTVPSAPPSQPPSTQPPLPADPNLPPGAGQLMSGADVRSILTRARYRWEGAAGASGTAITTPDGRIRIIWDTGAVNGRIRFNDTGYCSRFDGVRGGAEDCYRLYRVGPGVYEVHRLDGTRSGRIQIIG